MSNITYVLLYVDDCSFDESKLLGIIAHNAGYQHLEKINMSKSGGIKGFVHDVYAAALNHIPANEVIHWFRNLPWGDEDVAVLIIHNENGKPLTLTLVGEM